MRRPVISWSIVFALFVVSFAILVVSLNSSVFGAGGFVRSYLDALDRRDAAGALELAEVDDDGALFSPAALRGLGDIRSIVDRELEPGLHAVVVEYSVDGRDASTEFTVRHAGRRLGLFDVWRFDEPPIATVSATVLNDQRVRVNDLDVIASADTTAQYRVLVPGAYEFGHSSAYLTAEPTTLVASGVGEVLEVVVDVRANERFVQEVERDLTAYLDACAEQEVLQPAGCPFGKSVDDRIVSPPEWSIESYPEVDVIPGAEPGEWLVPASSARARIVVDVRSIFDGTVTTLDDVVSFRVSYVIAFDDDGGLVVTRRG